MFDILQSIHSTTYAGPYASYEGSPVSKGVLQPDMWGVTPSDRWDWPGIRQSVAQHGVRNSLLCAPMPTASTSQVPSSLPITFLVKGNLRCFHIPDAFYFAYNLCW